MVCLIPLRLNTPMLMLEVVSVIEEVAIGKHHTLLGYLLAQLHLGCLLHLDDDSGRGGGMGKGGELLSLEGHSLDDHGPII